MSPTLSPRHAPRYAKLARLLLVHGSSVLRAGPSDDADGAAADHDGDLAGRAGQLVDELEAMGPTFVKLGQLLSTRSDLLPAEYLDALARLRDDVEPLPPGVAQRVVQDELGFRVSKGFASFEEEPIGSASLGQVHRAALRDGRPVAVKVQRPDVERRVADDMEVVAELAAWLDAHSATAQRVGFVPMVEEFRRSITAELDYSLEAGNLRVLREQLARHRRIVVPRTVPDYCSRRVLTMELVEGRSISSIGPLGRLDLEGGRLAEELLRAYLDQVLVNGFFHADPHPGNVLLTVDGRLALVDAGMVARIGPGVRHSLLRLFLALSAGDGAEATAALEQLGDPLDGYDGDALRRGVLEVVTRAEGTTLATLAVGKLLADLVRASADARLRLPVELTFLGRALLNLDAVARVLDPDVDPAAIMRRHAVHVMRHGMLEDLSPAQLLSAAADAKDFVERLPGRLNHVLDALAEGKLTLNVEGVDEAELMRVGQKLANRAATGIVIAALLLAAGLFARAGGGAKLWGYPVLTVVLLLLAIAGCAWMLVGILRSDLPQRRRRSRS